LKMPLRNLSNTTHINNWILYTHQTTTLIFVSNLFPSSHSKMMVISKVKSLLATQCYTLVLWPIFPIPLAILIVLQKFLPCVLFFQVFSFSIALQLSVFFLPLLFSIIFQTHFLHSCCNTCCKCKIQIHYQETSNVKKFNNDSLLPCFLLG
jgi:hypothetical protein